MSYGILILLIVGTTYRVTKFVVADDFPWMVWLRDRLAGPEHEVFRDLPDGSVEVEVVRSGGWLPAKWAPLVVCAWCMSVYVGAAAVLVADVVMSVPMPVFVWLTASGATGFLASVEPE